MYIILFFGSDVFT